MQYAGEEYSFEDFVANDKVENEPDTANKGKSARKYSVSGWGNAEHHSPVFMGRRNNVDR